MYSMYILHDEQRNIHILITSAYEIDNSPKPSLG